ncbi:unnamed protein product [Adineta ricciae]|uniref:DUF8206 domain-containing protein n=1 Tax=Adineta ricciae TaxID=249248 RepID=A0A814TUA8_ADIRI|nr:unnamed protein product [Adineta ricciae]CAF1164918.1 unnamed protein product [Adineta ricciae]
MSKDINILLLGQTGVGKTTFINSFANYLEHHSLEDAVTGEFQVLIPATFVYMDSLTFDEREINIGVPHDTEQTKAVGESCTKECRSFVFRINNRTLRLIDTPGLGDTQGLMRDEKNLADILACISQYEHLNGICILLKPNEDRLHILYRYCLKEILRHLHVDAKENIMFVFTNARATSYQPGRSAPVLRELLKNIQGDAQVAIPFSKENTFLLDNEAFRFLAIYKNGIEVRSEEKADYSRSWSYTIKEFQRLIERIIKCEKHRTSNTISLNEAQQLIRKLSRPIGEISTLIQKNIELIERHKRNTQSNNNVKQEVLEQFDIELIELSYPRTVCTNSKCTKVIVVNGCEQIDYATHCHTKCYLTGVDEDLIGDEKLKSCAAINKSSG